VNQWKAVMMDMVLESYNKNQWKALESCYIIMQRRPSSCSVMMNHDVLLIVILLSWLL